MLHTIFTAAYDIDSQSSVSVFAATLTAHIHLVEDLMLRCVTLMTSGM